MIDSWYTENLVCPVEREPLHAEDGVLCSPSGRQYPVVDGIPVMIVEESEQTIGVASESLHRARSVRKNEETEDPFHIETLGISESEKQDLQNRKIRSGIDIDPVVSYLVGATNGIAYKSVIGALEEYPIPELRLPHGEGRPFLDIGCGWGGAARFIAERYGCEVVGVTVSREQVAYAQEHHGHLPVDIRLQDYRDVKDTFDRIISIGMFEHVGAKNYHTFMNTVRGLLKEDGLFLLHTIGGNRSVHQGDPWMSRYIFPNSMLPSAKQITTAAEELFVMEDWHNFGAHYDTTLLHWVENFDAAWPELKDKYGERFYRMWKYYLLSSAAGFRARKNQLWQIVFSPRGVKGGYESIR